MSAAAECRRTPAQLERHAETYTELHEGLAPRAFRCVPVAPRPAHVAVLGRISEIQYSKKIPSQVPHYHHPFAPHARPKFGTDAKGRLHAFAGRYTVTTRGIEDRPPSQVRRERLPSEPSDLTDLGKLEWIKYVWYDGSEERIGRLDFTPATAPTVSHDEHGHLHFLGGGYSVKEKAGNQSMARKHARRSNPKGRRRHRFAVRANPVDAQAVKRMAITGLVGGASVAATIIAAEQAVAMLIPTQPAYIQAAFKAAVGIVGGLGVGMLAPPWATPVAAGMAIGGFADGIQQLYTVYLAPQIASIGAPPAQSRGALAPGRQAHLPAGVPAGYQAYSPQSCGVAG